MLYRVLKNLTTGHCPGDIASENEFKPEVVPALLRVNAIAPVAPPPLSELPGWKTRAEKLLELNVVTATDLLEADIEAVKELFNYKTDRTVENWKREIRSFLKLNQPKKKKSG